MKIKGLEELKKSFSKINDVSITNNYLFKTAERLRKLTISKSANVSGEMIKETTVFMKEKGVATVAVNVPYASYQHEGKRADGSRVIRNRTAPGQKHFLRKSALELDLRADVNVILQDLSKKLL
jgi:hypothetical protein